MSIIKVFFTAPAHDTATTAVGAYSTEKCCTIGKIVLDSIAKIQYSRNHGLTALASHLALMQSYPE